MGVKENVSSEEIEKQYIKLQYLFKEEEKNLKIFEESYKVITKDIAHKEAIRKARSIASKLKRVITGEYISKHEKEVLNLINQSEKLSVKDAKIMVKNKHKIQGRIR